MDKIYNSTNELYLTLAQKGHAGKKTSINKCNNNIDKWVWLLWYQSVCLHNTCGSTYIDSKQALATRNLKYGVKLLEVSYNIYIYIWYIA